MEEILAGAGWIGRWAVGLVFAASLVGKVRGRAAFAGFLDGVRALTGVGGRRAAAVAGAVVAAELAVVALLARPPAGRWGFALAAVLLSVFTWRLAVTGTVACGCFGGPA